MHCNVKDSRIPRKLITWLLFFTISVRSLKELHEMVIYTKVENLFHSKKHITIWEISQELNKQDWVGFFFSESSSWASWRLVCM